MEKIEKKYIETFSGKIFYFTNKNFDPQKETLVYLHGLSANHTTWEAFIDDTEKLGFNCLLLDLRGHGYSDKTIRRSNYTLEVFSKDLLLILEVENITKYSLIGYSFGGAIAIDFAGRFCDKGPRLLALVSTNYISPFKYRHLIFFGYIYYSFLQFLALITLWHKRKEYLYYQHGKSVGYIDSLQNGFKTMPFSINNWMLSLIILLDLKEILPKIKSKTLIVNSAHDLYISQKETFDMERLIPDAKVSLIDVSGHYIGTNYQDKVRDVMIKFLKENI